MIKYEHYGNGYHLNESHLQKERLWYVYKQSYKTITKPHQFGGLQPYHVVNAKIAMRYLERWYPECVLEALDSI